MLSYQHLYHAGNLADVHKHALLAWMLDYLTRKDKPLSYLETHAGRGLYDLAAPEALRTGEAAAGIARIAPLLDPDHPYSAAIRAIRADAGPQAYPGSPLLAATILRPGDRMHLAELHPREHAALEVVLGPRGAHLHRQDGFEMARALCPPTPRRGLMLIDPSYELRDEYRTVPAAIGAITRRWNVGTIALWYPLLPSRAHEQMLATLAAAHPEALRHELRFGPARAGHRMAGSGMFIINPPYGTAAAADHLGAVFAAAAGAAPAGD